MPQFAPVYGTITSITPAAAGAGNTGCNLHLSIRTQDMGPVTLVVSPMTYVLEQETLENGDYIVAFYDTEAPAPAIFPPQYNAVLIAEVDRNTFAAFDFFNETLVSSDGNLQLNLPARDNSMIIQANGQRFFGRPGNQFLLVLYTFSTRSIPAQTTPELVVVFCQEQ